MTSGLGYNPERLRNLYLVEDPRPDIVVGVECQTSGPNLGMTRVSDTRRRVITIVRVVVPTDVVVLGLVGCRGRRRRGRGEERGGKG